MSQIFDDLSSVLDKKVGDFNKKGIGTPYKSRDKDSERLFSCWGDEFIKKQEANIYSYPAVLQNELQENGYNITVENNLLGGASSLSVMKFAGIADDVINTYIGEHQEMQGASLSEKEISVRTFSEDELKRNDQDSIPIIFMGYYGGWNNDLEELIKQQQLVLNTFDANKDKFLIIGIPPMNGSVDKETYDSAMQKKWGKHYMNATTIAAPKQVASYDGQNKIAIAIYEKLKELKYIVKDNTYE